MPFTDLAEELEGLGYGNWDQQADAWYRKVRSKRATFERIYGVTTCHPELEHKAKGLCSTCFQKQYQPKRNAAQRDKRHTRGAVPRGTGVVQCGHPDRKHAGRGMCKACHLRDLRARKKAA